MFVDVDLEALAIAAVLPVSDGITNTVEERAAAQINPAHQHAAEMAYMTDVAATEAKGSEKFQGGHDDDEGAHAHLDGNREHDDLAVWKEDGAGQEKSKDGAGSADGGDVGRLVSPENGNGIYDDVDDAGADSGKEIILEEARAAPNEFQFAAEHVEHKHVGEDVPDGGAVMQE